MREELRQRLPRTTGCGALVAAGLVVVLAVIAFLVWHLAVADTPSRMVQSFMSAARDGDTETMKACLTPEARTNPLSEKWLGQLAVALGQRGAVLKDADILGDRATVHVLVPHRSGTGAMVATAVGVESVRTDDGWLIDLEPTMASVPHQFWTTITQTP